MAYKRKSPMPEIEGGTNQLTYTTGDVLYASAANTLSKLAVGSNTQVLTLAAGIPSWAAPSGGLVIQQIRTQSSTYTTSATLTPVDNTIPQITEGTEFFTVAITPTSASSVLVIEATMCTGCSTGANLVISLFVDATTNAIAATTTQKFSAGSITTMVLRHKLSAGSTSTRTYRIRYGANTGTSSVNGNPSSQFFNGVLYSMVTATEYSS